MAAWMFSNISWSGGIRRLLTIVKYHLVPISIILLKTESTGMMLLNLLDCEGKLGPDLVDILVGSVL